MSNKSNQILVIGAGVAGLQTARDLADRGYKVHLVEKQPYIGGKIMQLDETFPVAAVSESCSLCYPLCYMLPEISKIYLNDNIHVHTYSEIHNINRNNNEYEVEIAGKARYVDPDKCNGCGKCVEICPVSNISDEFNYGLSERSAVYQPLPGSIYPDYIIDVNNCLHFGGDKCSKCLQVCPYDAINFEETPQITKLNVQSVVVATGYEQIKPEVLTKYGTDFPNVLTSMQFERMNSINGPTGGKIQRLSDNTEPKSIAFIQCVGSRENKTPGCVSYCSTVCCMYSSKEALNVKKKKLPDCECSIFNTEKRGYGKQYYDMIIDARENWGVNYVDGRVTLIKENLENHNLIIRYEDVATGEYHKEEVEMVVLAAGLTKTVGKARIAQLLGSALDSDGLFNAQEIEKLEENNVFVAGFARYPMNIPDAVTDGSAVAARISEKIPIPLEKWEKPSESEDSEYMESSESQVDDDPVNIGIFYCEFQDQISKVIDLSNVIDRIKQITDVSIQKIIKNAYSKDGRKEIQSVIKENKLNRVIFSAGSPRYYEDYFKDLVNEAELNPSLIEIVDLREQDVYIHSNERDYALEKAIDLIRQAINKVRDFIPLETEKFPVLQEVIVIADDYTGILCAQSIADQKVPVHLILSNDVSAIGISDTEVDLTHSNQYMDKDSMEVLLQLEKSNSGIEIYENAKIQTINGFAGDFTVTLANEEKTTIKAGAIVVSGGTTQSQPPKGQFNYGKSNVVFTQQEFQSILDNNNKAENIASSPSPDAIEKAIFILCANQRLSPNSDYRKKIERQFGADLVITSNCSNICCSRALEQAYKLRKHNENVKIFILYRDMQVTGGKLELIYRKAKSDFIFLRYSENEELRPKISGTPGQETIALDFHELNSDSKIHLEADALVVATPIVLTKRYEDLSAKLKIRTEKHGFLQEEHSKVLPFNSTKKGIFLCGSSQWPNNPDIAVSQALAAATQSVKFISKGYIESLPGVAHVEQTRCVGCGKCIGVCPYGAVSFDIMFKEYVFGMRKIRQARINPLLCEACGLCVSECPVGTITIPNSNDGSFKRLIRTYTDKKGQTQEDN